jgi:hypothetical protein
MALIVGPAAAAPAKIYVTQNNPLDRIVGTVFSKAGTVTGTAGVGSSLFLQRIALPAAMTISEIQQALSIAFPATNQGAGTMSQSFAIFSIGNSTSLATLYSASGSSSWNTGTSTAGASTSLTQYQGGWSAPFIQPMTFATTTLSAGDYVIGRLFDFAQASSTWTLNFYGANAAATATASFASSITWTVSNVMQFSGLAAVSAFTGSGTVSVFSNAGTLAVNNWELSSNTMAATAVSAITSATSISTKSASITARTIFSAAPSTAGVLSSTALSAGSFFGTTGSLAALASASLGSATSTLASTALPNFGFIGTGSTTSGLPTVFMAGIMSTGGIPAAITVTSNAVTYSGSVAFQQPWFALVGS